MKVRDINWYLGGVCLIIGAINLGIWVRTISATAFVLGVGFALMFALDNIGKK